jgi:hypothetical protein
LIYSHKPQRSGRGIASNTNNPPQDPPAPHEEKIIPPVVDKIPTDTPKVRELTDSEKKMLKPKIPIPEVPDIPIEDTTPPVPEECPEDKPFTPKAPLVSDSIPEPKVIDTPEVKVDKQTAPKLSWFRKLVMRIKKFFRG